ncbi:MAG: ABC transporter substrate-binding protein [Casimicrobiaceae bacterium]
MKFRTSPTPRLPLAFLVGAALAIVVSTRDASGADPSKTLRVEFRVAESGFDPQAVSESYSFHVVNAIFDSPYTYDYFARPVRLVPNAAAALPQISDGGRTYTFRIKPGIHFADHAAFKGKKRELVAADYVFSIKRMFDPKVRSYWLYLFEHNLLGLDMALAAARKTGRFDYDAPLEGLQALDRYTLRIKFKRPDYAFQHWLTTGQFGAVAREVIDLHRDGSNRAMEHPVGTGPFLLKAWTRGKKIVLAANPNYCVETYPAPSSATAPDDAAMAKDFANKTLPLVGNVEISILEEAQPRLLTFERGELDYIGLPASLAGNVLANDVLKPAFAQRGIRLHRQADPSLSFTFFNMDNGVVGGYTKEKIALRRAISLGYDRATGISLLLNGQALPATQPIPPGVPGYDPSLAESKPYDPAAARALLDQFGYRDRDGDGYRELPNGKPLTILRDSQTEMPETRLTSSSGA